VLLLFTWATWAMWKSLMLGSIVGAPLSFAVVGSVLFPGVPSKHALPHLNGLNFAIAAGRLLSTSYALSDASNNALRVKVSPGAHATLLVSTLGAVARALLTAGSRGRLFWPTIRGVTLLNGAALGATSMLQMLTVPDDEIPAEDLRIVKLSPESALTGAGLLVLIALGFGPATRFRITGLSSDLQGRYKRSGF
jgi:hypothetical protein